MPEQNRKAGTLDSGALPVLWDGASAGTVEQIREGLYLRFSVSVPARADLRGTRQGTLLRVWLIGDGGEARLGTLEPSGGRLALSRRLSLRSLAPLGRLLRCEVRPALEDCGPCGTEERPYGTEERPYGTEERPSGTEERLSSAEGELFGTAETVTGTAELMSGTAEPRPAPDILPRPGGGVLLSYPADGPFPLPELFCFAVLDSTQGRERWVFAFDREGRPVFR